MKFARPARLAFSLLVTLATPAVTFAQPPNLKVDQGGGIHVTEHFAVVFGGIKQGSGIALGPAISHTFENGAFAQLKGVYSIRQFKLLQARFDLKPLFTGRSLFSTRLRWQDAPELALYPLGPDSINRRVEYGERKTELRAFL